MRFEDFVESVSSVTEMLTKPTGQAQATRSKMS